MAAMPQPDPARLEGSVGVVETQFVDLPDALPLDCGRALHRVRVAYETYGELMQFGRERRERHRGELRDTPTLTMFCFALRRPTWERIGPLDERFGIGTLEDDDYCHRIRGAGLRLRRADPAAPGQGAFDAEKCAGSVIAGHLGHILWVRLPRLHYLSRL